MICPLVDKMWQVRGSEHTVPCPTHGMQPGNLDRRHTAAIWGLKTTVLVEFISYGCIPAPHHFLASYGMGWHQLHRTPCDLSVGSLLFQGQRENFSSLLRWCESDISDTQWRMCFREGVIHCTDMLREEHGELSTGCHSFLVTTKAIQVK